MTKRYLPLIAFLLTFVVWAEAKKHIIVIYANDMGYGDCTGRVQVEERLIT